MPIREVGTIPCLVMSQVTAGSLPIERRARRPQLPRWLPASAVYALLVVLCLLAAYWAMFSQFAPYDDEGFFDYSLKLFVAGHPLYNSVFSEYGPFYYELFGGLFALIGHGVTTDAGRLIQLLLWVGASLSLGLASHRLTGRLALGVAAFATSFTLMNTLTNEPMHAEALICGLLTAMAIVIAFGVRARPRSSLCVLGALAAALLLTKINVGAYAVISIAFAAVMAGPSLVRYAVLRYAVIIALVLIGPAVMASRLNIASTRVYALLAVLSAVSLVFVATPLTIDAVGSDESARWPRWLIGGFVACLVVVLALIFALGTSPSALINETVVLPSHQASFLVIPAPLNVKVVWWSLAAAGLAWTLRQIGRAGIGPIGAPSLGDGLLRLLAGLAILLSLGNAFPFAIAPNAPFALAMPLAWVAALPSRRDAPGPRERLVRLLIPSLAILQSLLAFPVAGSQLRLGAILLVLCGAICLADAWSELVAWNRGRPSSSPVAASGLTALFVALALGTTFEYIVQPLQSYHDTYRGGTPVVVHGASRLHLPPPLSGAFEQIVGTLRAHCRTVITLPGMYSFNLWSDLPAPSPMTGAQPYWLSLSSTQQRAVLTAAKASPGLCLVRNDAEAETYTGGGPVPRVPLVVYLEDDFAPIVQTGPYAVETRRP